MTVKHMIDFIERSEAFDNAARLKALLVVIGVKPATFIHFRVTPKNIDDKMHFEKHLRELGLPFKVSRAKGFEEIRSVRGGTVEWHFKGIWYGYDIFKDLDIQKKFMKYKSLIRQKKEKQAAIIGGEVYGYPKKSVTTFIKELDLKYIAKKFSYGEYFKRLHQSDFNFPFIQHTACSAKCPVSNRLNEKYKKAIRKHAPDFYKSFTKKTVVKAPLLINFENDLLYKGKSIWPSRKMHDFTAISHKRIDGKYFLVSFLTKTPFIEGDLVDSELSFQYNTCKVKPLRKVKHFKDVIHKRKMVKL